LKCGEGKAKRKKGKRDVSKSGMKILLRIGGDSDQGGEIV